MTGSRVRRLSALAVVGVTVWGMVLVGYGVSDIAHHSVSTSVIAALVLLVVLVAVCAWTAARLWRNRSD
jgi:hypothetical protein